MRAWRACVGCVGLSWLQVLAFRQVAAVPMGGRATLSAGDGGRMALPPFVPDAGLRRTQTTTAGSPPDGPCTVMYRHVQEVVAAGHAYELGGDNDPDRPYLQGHELYCDENGNYMPVQLRASTGDYYCVDIHTGKILPGTMVPPNTAPLVPLACLRRANPPPGSLGLHQSCQTNKIPESFLQQNPFARTHAACDEDCWWNHCRVQPQGYCPTCADGLICEGTFTTYEGFMHGGCAKPDPSDLCVDDPKNFLADMDDANCGVVEGKGWCDVDLSVLSSAVPKGTMGRQVCPRTCNACPPPPPPPPAVEDESLSEVLGDVLYTGRAIAESTCYGCWSDSVGACRHVDPLDPNLTKESLQAMQDECTGAGDLWRPPADMPGLPRGWSPPAGK